MSLLTQSFWAGAFLLELALLWRAKATGSFSRLPLFNLYIAYTCLQSLVGFLIFWLRPALYPSAFWLLYLVELLAEFAVIPVITDRVFGPYPAIRYVGRVIAGFITVGFTVFLAFPALTHPLSSSLATIKFALWASLTKIVMIAAVIVVARYYRVPFDRSAVGLVTGFALYLGLHATILATGQAFGRQLSRWGFQFIVPSGWVVCLLTWTVTLWNPEPVTEEAPDLQIQPDWVLSHELDRLNEALSKRLGR